MACVSCLHVSMFLKHKSSVSNQNEQVSHCISKVFRAKPSVLARLVLGSVYATEADVSCCMNQYLNVSNSGIYRFG